MLVIKSGKPMSRIEGLSPTIQRYLKLMPTSDKKKQAEHIDALESYIKNHKGQLSRVKRKHKNKVYQSPDGVESMNRRMILAINEFSKEISEKIFEYETSNLRTLINTANEMLTVISKNSKINVDFTGFYDDTSESCARNSEYKALKKKRRSLGMKRIRLLTKVNTPDIHDNIRSELLLANRRYNDDLQYSPPSEFDSILAYYIIHSPANAMVEGTASVIAEGATDIALYAIGEFSHYIYEHLNITNATSQVIIYTSLVRFLFDEAYSFKSELREFETENRLFLKKCETFSKIPVKDLKLEESIIKKYTTGLPITSLFKSKQVSLLKQMETMTNPIDLMVHVHVILTSLAKYFGTEGGFLSFDDTLTLLLGLTSMNPPANAFSIAKFVEKWNDVQLSSIVGIAKNYFVAGVDHLLKLEGLESSNETEFFV